MSRNLWAGIAMTVVGLVVVFILIPYGVVEPKKVKYAALSPSYYPRLIALSLIALGLAISVREILALRSVVQVEGPSSDHHPRAASRIATVFAILIFYAVSVSWLGFIVASFIVLLMAFWLAGERRIPWILGLSILLPLGLYFFFLKVAGIPIPLGILEPILAGV